MMRSAILLTLFVLMSFFGRSSHVMGGDITWTCQGGNYVFQLVFYRDCNGADVNTISENLDVWNHATINQITVNFVSRTDVSPFCTEVPGGPTKLDCGFGANGGNGLGAIEKVVYQSAPINIPGTPPAEGWVFTYQNFSRNGSLTNLQNPTTYGITLVSKMYAIPNAPGTCVDNSPQFLQEPYFVSCVGDPYEYNMNAVDMDLDSLSISFGAPLDHFPGVNYNPPIAPAPIPFETNFSPSTPTPGPWMNAGNIDAALDPNSGNLTFLSNNSGNFAVKVVVQSYRQGVLIAEIEREMQLIVQNCAGNNNPPVIGGPFGGLFETTVDAGDLVNFNISSTDVELLQDGTPQSNIMTATGLLFGPNPTLPVGCAIAPCPTLNTLPPVTMVQGSNATFDWQTSCDHLESPYGYVADLIPYHFVFKVQDDYCPIPKVKYATVTINVRNPNVIPPTEITCIQSDATGDVTINWNAVNDPGGTFSEYQIHSVQNGQLGTVANINTTSFTVPAVTQQEDYFITVASGCNGNTLRHSDTISNIYLQLNNPVNGTAVLTWNDPVTPPYPSMNGYYHIYREYPVGTWSLYDSVPYGTTAYIDTITICSVDLNYQIVLPNTPCDFTSNIQGDNFQDLITPDIPIIAHVSIDTTNANTVNISWNQNAQPDTYGYVIYQLIGGIVVPIDTVWNINNTSYVHTTPTDQGPVTYSVAAFDSCWTATVPPTYQTSAKGDLNTSTFLQTTLNICERTVDLNWTNYIGWPDIDHYEIFGTQNGGSWINYGSTADTNFTINVDVASTYCFVVEGVSTNGNRAFSNTSCLYIAIPGQPAFSYLQVATVNGEQVNLTHFVDNSVNIAEVVFQRKNDAGDFDNIGSVPVTGSTLNFVDTDVDVMSESYVYRAQIIDSCGGTGAVSNEAQTILLQVTNDDVRKLNYLSWNSYYDFDGPILGYHVYRGINGVYSGTPIATVGTAHLYFEDDVNDIVSTGKICYYVEAIEGMNVYGFSEVSRSNEVCVILPPIIYIPNAFMPDGVNKIFIPVVSDFDPSDYDFSVFNRWGQIIFSTNDPTVGWDGMVQGTDQMAATGSYLYMLKLIDGNGIEIIKRGHVTLLK